MLQWFAKIAAHGLGGPCYGWVRVIQKRGRSDRITALGPYHGSVTRVFNALIINARPRRAVLRWFAKIAAHGLGERCYGEWMTLPKVF
jgi:hypothetical protein